jgi:AraC-like DNA-binding protein
VAAEVGYESEAAFNRAFKKFAGQPPGTWRRGRQAAAEAGQVDHDAACSGEAEIGA